MNVFVLQHVREYDDGEGEDVKLIGVYSTEENANATIRRFLKLPGFRDYPNGFHVSKYPLDKDHWAEGFGIPWPPDPDQ